MKSLFKPPTSNSFVNCYSIIIYDDIMHVIIIAHILYLAIMSEYGCNINNIQWYKREKVRACSADKGY